MNWPSLILREQTLFSHPLGKGVGRVFAHKAKAGAVVIDNTSHFRMDEDVPLVVPEVNPHDIEWHTKRGIIANPNCSTIQMVVALKPLNDIAKIKRVVVSTYQSVSGGGKPAMDELFQQTRHFYMNDQANPDIFPKQISFNVIPQIDKFMDDGMTKEEWKMVVETNKIMGTNINVCANCVRVPVSIGHSEMVNVEFESPLSPKDAMKAWNKARGVTVIDLDSDLGYVTPVEIAGEDDVFVSRVRADNSVEYGLNFWCVCPTICVRAWRSTPSNRRSVGQQVYEKNGGLTFLCLKRVKRLMLGLSPHFFKRQMLVNINVWPQLWTLLYVR